MDGEQPAQVPDAVISEIRSRERGGLVELPHGLRPGMRVRHISGPLSERTGMPAVLRPHERVLVLLQLLGGERRVDLASNAIEVAELIGLSAAPVQAERTPRRALEAGVAERRTPRILQLANVVLANTLTFRVHAPIPHITHVNLGARVVAR